MFEKLISLPADPILGLGQAFREDTNPDKISLSVGVYQNSDGETPIFTAVKKAEHALLSVQKTKAYVSQAGDPAFLTHMTRMVFGDSLTEQLGQRVAAVMTPGGCGALRMGAELLVSAKPNATLWVSNPTWGNHYPLLESAGLQLKPYDYYDASINGVNFQRVLDSLSQIPEGDVVLLHGCCHNPTGADFTKEQWDQVLDILLERRLLAFFDIAYQGFGEGLTEDAYSIREAAKRLPEVLLATSCSKNFGLYRERVGSIMVISQTPQQTNAAQSHILSAARRSYSMSPYHGGGIVGHLLGDSDLNLEWKEELEHIRLSMNALRVGLSEGLNQAQSKIDFSFVAQSKGMFCYLGIAKADVLTLRSEYGIYLLENTRINVAGLSESNLPIVIERTAEVISR